MEFGLLSNAVVSFDGCAPGFVFFLSSLFSSATYIWQSKHHNLQVFELDPVDVVRSCLHELGSFVADFFVFVLVPQTLHVETSTKAFEPLRGMSDGSQVGLHLFSFA